jgi:hypothetical protein
MIDVVSSVPKKSPAPVMAEVEEDEAGLRQGVEKESRVAEPAPKIPIGESIEPPLCASTFLSEACLIAADEVAGILQQQSTGDIGAASISRGEVLVMPPKYHYAITTELLDDPMLHPARLKLMMEMHHELHNFLKVHILFQRNLMHCSMFC